MMYAHVIDGTVESVGGLPGSARLLATGQWLCPNGGLINATDEERASCGWFPVTDTPPTYDPATEVLVRGDVIVVDGSPTVSYTVRDKTQTELADAADVADRHAKGVNVGRAVATLRQWAEDAEATNVTSGNAVAALSVVVDRLGVFFDRFADLLEFQEVDRLGEA